MSEVVRESERKYDAQDYLALPSLTDMPGTVVAARDVLDADGVLPADEADDRVGARWACGDTPLAWREMAVGLGERGDGDRRCRPGRTVWGAVPVVGRLVVGGLGNLVARRAARAAAP
jgi:hypothetical protein